MNHNKFCWENTFNINYHEIDCYKALKPSVLLNYLQDMATVNAEMLGFGYSFTFPRNYAWFLIKYHMEFDKYPSDMDQILLKTEARGISRVLASRDFEIWTPDKKERLGRIISNWSLIDINKKKILALNKAIDFLPSYEKRPDDIVFNKVYPPDRIDMEKVFEIRYEDIDINQHVNNSNYIVWAFEPLPFDFRISKKPKKLDIVYIKETKYGDNIISQVQIDNNTTCHVLKNAENNQDLCLIKADWE